LENFEILSSCQFGFRKGLTTEHAIIRFTDIVYSALNSNNFIFSVFLDFQKAFDLVNHSILLKKLETYGIRGNAYSFIKTFISNRTNHVKVNGEISNGIIQTIGLAQGSCISPILFLLFINDLPRSIRLGKPILFADDTTLIFHSDSFPDLVSNCNEDLERISEWCMANRLSINAEKSNIMLITNRDRPTTIQPIFLNNKIVSFCNEVKFLGLIVDSKLKFTSHILAISNKISRNLGIFYKIRHFVDKKILLKLYYAFVYPYLIYCNVIWGGTNAVHLNLIIKMQKRIIRIIHHEAYRSHTRPLFVNSEVLRINEIYRYLLCLFVFENRPIFANNENTGHSTRQNNDLRPEFQRLTLTQKSVKFSAPSTWNLIPERIRSIDNLDFFKIELKKYFISQIENE